jgi:hypothetical protein
MAAMALATSPVESLQQSHRLTLQKNTVAFESSGPLIELPSGMELELVGQGLVDSMVKVRANKTLYFVFLRDLDYSIDDAASLYG